MLIEILLIVLILTAIALCVYMIASLKKINQKVDCMQKDIHDIYEKTLPLIENFTEISEKASKVINGVEHYWSEISDSVGTVKEKFSIFGKNREKSTSSNPVESFIKNLRAISTGIAAFWSSLKNN